MSDRRTFLSLLGFGGLGLALPRVLPKAVVFEPDVFKLHAPPLNLLGLGRLTEAVESELRRIVGGRWNDAPQKGVNHEWPHQCHVNILPPTGEDLDLEKYYIKPAAETLAAYLRRKGLHEYAPVLSWRSQETEIAYGKVLRGVHQWNLLTDQHYFRFDLMARA